MALATTTLSATITAIQPTIVVASAASMAPGRLILIDQEMLQVAQSYTTGTTVPVLRGREGTQSAAHFLTAAVTHGTAADFAAPSPQTATTYPVQRPVVMASITTTSTSLVLPTAGQDMRVVINLATACALTVPVPTKDMDGTELWIVSSTVAAHVVTFTGGLGGVGSGYTALTAAAGAQMCIHVLACNGTWNLPSAPAWTGTVTKVTAGIA